MKANPLNRIEPFRIEPFKRDVLMDAVTLLDTCFHPASRPSVRWLRKQQKKRTVPFIKIGSKVLFDPIKFRQALAKNFTVEARA
jgi:hypothetical protein